MPSDEVRVTVRKKHVADLKVRLPCVFDILIDVALRIDNDGLPR